MTKVTTRNIVIILAMAVLGYYLTTELIQHYGN